MNPNLRPGRLKENPISLLSERSRLTPDNRHFAINVFGAAATLAIESRASTSAGGPNFSTDLEKALQFLKRIAKQNPVAEHSIPILISLIGEDN